MSIAVSTFQSDDPEWWAKDDVAKKLRINSDHLGRLCKEKFGPDGLAELRLCAGGPPKWFISRGALVQLRGEQIATVNAVPELSGFTENQRDTAGLRKQCVIRYRRIHHDPALRNCTKAEWAMRVVAWAKESFEGFGISVRSLRRWDQKFNGDSDLVKLIDTRGGDRCGRRFEAGRGAFKSIHCDPRKPAIAHTDKLVRILAEENGWAWPKNCPRQSQVDSWIPPAVQDYNRDHARWLKTQSPYIRQDSEAWGAGDRYITDHKNMDLWVRYKGRVIRPWLTTFIDHRTRKITGFCVSEIPCTDTIISALRMAIKDPSNKGGPRECLTDRGRDYRSECLTGQTNAQRRAAKSGAIDNKQLCGKFGLLGIELHLANAYSPNSKSRQERWFDRLREFSQHFPTYTGHNSETKPPGLNKILADGRAVPSFDEVARRLADFIKGYNGSAEHGMEDLAENGVKLSPSEAYSRWAGTVTRNLDDEAINVILRGPHRLVSVTRNGVALRIGGQTYHYGGTDTRLVDFRGDSRRRRTPIYAVWNPEDMATIEVWTQNWKRIGTVSANLVGGASLLNKEGMAFAQREKRTLANAHKIVRTHDLSTLLTPTEHAHDASIRIGREERQAEFPKLAVAENVRIRRTPLDGQAKRAQPQELRRAVGDGINHDDDRGPSMLDALRSNLTPRRRGEEIGSRSVLESLESLTHGD